MSQLFNIHPTHPQARLISRTADLLRQGALVVLPTDTTYVLVCQLSDRNALQRLRRVRELSESKPLTLLCANLSHLGQYAKVDNTSFRILKHYTPGPFTFILEGTREMPKRLLHPKRKTVALRVSPHPVLVDLLEVLAEPVITTTMALPTDDLPLTDPVEIRERLQGQVDLVVDSGSGGVVPTTVVDLSGGAAEVLRQGAGDFG